MSAAPRENVLFVCPRRGRGAPPFPTEYARAAAEIAAKRKQEKRGVKNTTITVTDPKTGKTMEKNLSASEMNKRRLEYARQLDAERYKDERTVPLSELNKQDKE